MFSSLKDPMLKKIAEVTLVTEFSAGSYIFKEGRLRQVSLRGDRRKAGALSSKRAPEHDQ